MNSPNAPNIKQIGHNNGQQSIHYAYSSMTAAAAAGVPKSTSAKHGAGGLGQDQQ